MELRKYRKITPKKRILDSNNSSKENNSGSGNSNNKDTNSGNAKNSNSSAEPESKMAR